MKEPQTTLVVPDTNALIHFRLFDDLPWGEVTGVERPLLAIVWPVVRELDKLKSDPRTRDRAKTVLSKIESLFADSDEATLRNGTSARFFHADGLLETMRQVGLDPQIGDDLVLGSVLALHRAQHAVVLATDDSGMRLRARAYGVAVRPMPQELRLNSADPLMAENAKLRRENEDLKLALPRLEVAFSEGGQSIRVVRPPVPDRKSPRAKGLLTLQPLRLDRLPSIYETDLSPPTQKQVDAYNAALDEFRPEFEKYVAQRTAYEQFPYLSIEIALMIRNSGGRPAERLKLSLSSPAQVELLQRDQVPAEPAEPVKPKLPGRRRYYDDYSHGRAVPTVSVRYDGSSLAEKLSSVLLPSVGEPADPDIEVAKDGTTSAVFHFRSLSNFDEIQLPPLFARFKSPEDVGSFHFRYTLRSHSLPKLLTGKLHVRVDRSESEDDESTNHDEEAPQ